MKDWSDKMRCRILEAGVFATALTIPGDNAMPTKAPHDRAGRIGHVEREKLPPEKWDIPTLSDKDRAYEAKNIRRNIFPQQYLEKYLKGLDGYLQKHPREKLEAANLDPEAFAFLRRLLQESSDALKQKDFKTAYEKFERAHVEANPLWNQSVGANVDLMPFSPRTLTSTGTTLSLLAKQDAHTVAIWAAGENPRDDTARLPDRALFNPLELLGYPDHRDRSMTLSTYFLDVKKDASQALRQYLTTPPEKQQELVRVQLGRLKRLANTLLAEDDRTIEASGDEALQRQYQAMREQGWVPRDVAIIRGASSIIKEQTTPKGVER